MPEPVGLFVDGPSRRVRQPASSRRRSYDPPLRAERVDRTSGERTLFRPDVCSFVDSLDNGGTSPELVAYDYQSHERTIPHNAEITWPIVRQAVRATSRRAAPFSALAGDELGRTRVPGTGVVGKARIEPDIAVNNDVLCRLRDEPSSRNRLR